MIHWIDIASIVFVCVTMNHLGLISAIERATQRKLWIVDCPKCCSCWCVLLYLLYHFVDINNMVTVLAISFLCSYIAIWLELFEGYIDTLYIKLYEKIYPDSENDTPATDPDKGDSPGTVPEL